jgi:hypothetical protein
VRHGDAPFLAEHHRGGHAGPVSPLVVLGPRLGRYSSNDVSQVNPSAINAVETAIWQLATLPRAPQYCRCTPTDAVPCLGRPVSSIAKTPWRTGISSRRRRQNGRTSHVEWVMKC